MWIYAVPRDLSAITNMNFRNPNKIQEISTESRRLKRVASVTNMVTSKKKKRELENYALAP
jgi:hypothetical protein